MSYWQNINNTNTFQRVATALSWSVTYTFLPQKYNLLFSHIPTLIFFKKHEAVGRWVHAESTKKAQVRACARNNIYTRSIP
nr:MAG TPA: hypothetical protein [Caudoviricetes sp.]